jgi:hypothetical protein
VPGWSINQWAFYPNGTALFVDYLAMPHLTSDVNPSWAGTSFFDNTARFEVCNYDGNWTYIRAVSKPAPRPTAYRYPSDGGLYLADGPLNGNMLFKFVPPLPANTMVTCAQ